MALKELLSGLEGGLDAYPNHNTPSTSGGFNYGGSTSIFDTKTFNQKSFKFGQGTAFDRPNGGFSNEPFITNPTIDILAGNPNVETAINLFTDGLIRGGAITHAERLITDTERIGKFLISPKGLAFITKQVGLQATNPKISRPGLGLSRANQRIYNVGINTLASVASAGTGLYVKRAGLTPLAHDGYADAKALFRDNNDNRLWNLFETHIEGQTTTDNRERGRFGQFFSNLGQGLKKLKNFLVGGNEGELLYSYSGGPGSLFGIGRTQIKKYGPFSTDVGEGANGIPRNLFKNGYLEKNRFNITQEGYTYGVSNIFLPNFEELNGVNTNLLGDIYSSPGFGDGPSGERLEDFEDQTSNPLRGSKYDIEFANADSGRGNYLPGGKFIINQENLQEGDPTFYGNGITPPVWDSVKGEYTIPRQNVHYLNKPSKFRLSNRITSNFQETGEAISKYSDVILIEDDVLRYETDQNILDPEDPTKTTLISTKVISLPPFYSTLKGINADSYVDNFLITLSKTPSSSTLSRQSYQARDIDKFEPFLENIKNLKSIAFGFTPDMGALLNRDLDSNEQQFSPELKLKDAPLDIILGAGSILGGKLSLTLNNLGFNPFSYQSIPEVNVGGTVLIEGGKAARIPWVESYQNYAGLRGNVPLGARYADPNFDGTTSEMFVENGFTQIKSAEYDGAPQSLDPDKGDEFDHTTYFANNPKYTISAKNIQDFRALKKFDINQTHTNYQRITNYGRKYHRETRVNTGNPGKKIDNKLGVNIFGQPSNSYTVYDKDTIDKINALDIFEDNGNFFEKAEARDLIRFRIESLHGDNPGKSKVMVFRAFLDDFGDSYTGNWNSYKYNGRAENFYTYNGFDRKINFSFKIAAQSRHEMVPIFRKLNYLVSQTAPDYSDTRMRGNFCRLCIGSMIDRTPGFFTAINLKWQKNYPWDIAISHLEMNEDADGMNVMPHVLDVSCQFTPIHNFIPKKSVTDSPFILPHENNRRIPLKTQKWYSYEAAPTMKKALYQHGQPTSNGNGVGTLMGGQGSTEEAAQQLELQGNSEGATALRDASAEQQAAKAAKFAHSSPTIQPIPPSNPFSQNNGLNNSLGL